MHSFKPYTMIVKTPLLDALDKYLMLQEELQENEGLIQEAKDVGFVELFTIVDGVKVVDAAYLRSCRLTILMGLRQSQKELVMFLN